jgi:hypothetical protein
MGVRRDGVQVGDPDRGGRRVPLHPWDSCDGSASQGRPNGDEWFYNCTIYAFPGTRAKPNPATWRCFRQSFFSPGYGGFIDAWTSENARGTAWPDRRFKELRDCLAPRAVMRLKSRSVQSRTLRPAAMCSRPCAADVTALRNGRVVGRGRRPLPAWRERPIRLDLSGRARSATRLVLRLSVEAGRWSGRDTTTANVARGKWHVAKAADAVLRR